MVAEYATKTSMERWAFRPNGVVGMGRGSHMAGGASTSQPAVIKPDRNMDNGYHSVRGTRPAEQHWLENSVDQPHMLRDGMFERAYVEVDSSNDRASDGNTGGDGRWNTDCLDNARRRPKTILSFRRHKRLVGSESPIMTARAIGAPHLTRDSEHTSQEQAHQTSAKRACPSPLDHHRAPPVVPSKDDTTMILQLETRPISEEQLVNEVKGIYAGLVMVEKKCVEICTAQAQKEKHLSNEQWQALIALHRSLLHEHHDFFLASQHPAASPALRRLGTKYAMPARMWRHGIHSFLEILRARLPDPIDHMLSFVYQAYSMMALLMESVPSFSETWIECLGDLARYRMAIEENDARDREIWANVARMWYEKAADRSPTLGRLQNRPAVLGRPLIVEQLIYYSKALFSAIPFLNARDPIMLSYLPLFSGISLPGQEPRPANAHVVAPSGTNDTSFSCALQRHVRGARSNGFDYHILADSVLVPFSTEAGHLDTTKRHGDVQHYSSVDTFYAHLQDFSNPSTATNILRIEIPGQADLRVICQLDDPNLSLKGEQGGNEAEGLVAGDGHVSRRIADHGGREEVGPDLWKSLALSEEFAALFDRVVAILYSFGHSLFVYKRSESSIQKYPRIERPLVTAARIMFTKGSIRGYFAHINRFT